MIYFKPNFYRLISQILGTDLFGHYTQNSASLGLTHSNGCDYNSLFSEMIDTYELGPRIHEDGAAGLQVFEAKVLNNPKRFFVKRYSFNFPQEIDSLLKAARKDTREEHSHEAIIANVVFIGFKKPSRCCIDLVYENLLGTEWPWDCIKRNQRSKISPGLDNYWLGGVIYENPVRNLEVKVARSQHRNKQVIIKCLKNVHNLLTGNTILKEAIAQALVAHRYNCGLLDIACTSSQSNTYEISLVMEKLDHDFEKELQQRKEEQKPFTIDELLSFLSQVTSGLLHAKGRVAITQGFAHRDIKLANIFRASDGSVKVGDFGSVWHQGGSTSVPRRIPSLLSTTEFEEFAQSGDGTLGYLSPEMKEMILGRDIVVDSYTSDIFSLGVCLLELVKLDRITATFAYSNLSDLANNLEREIKLISLNKWFKLILRLFLNIDPTQRPTLEFINHVIMSYSCSKTHIWVSDYIECMTNSNLEKLILQINNLPAVKNSNAYQLLQNNLNIVRASIRLLQSNPGAAETYVQRASQYQIQHLFIRKFSYVSSCLAIEAQINLQRKQYSEALKVAKELEHFAANQKEKIPDAWIASLALLAQIYCAMREYQEAAIYANHCLANLKTANSIYARSTVVAYRVLGIERMNGGELRQAERYLLLSLQQIAQYFPRNFRLMIQAYTDLAEVYLKAELLQESLHCAKRALGFINKFCCGEEKNFTDNLTLFREINLTALAQFLPHLEPNYRALHAILSNCKVISRICLKMGNFREAEEIILKALDISIQYAEGPDFADIYHNLSMIEKELGNLSDAQRFCVTAKMIYQRYQENYQECVLKCTIDLAEIYYSQGNFTECRNMLRECEVELDRKSTVYLQKCNLELNLSVLFGKMNEADQFAQTILDVFIESPLFATPQLYNSLAFYYAAKLQSVESEDYFRKALTLLGKNVLRDNTSAAISNFNLACILLQCEQLQEAEVCARKCIDLLHERNHPLISNAYLCLAIVFRDKRETSTSMEMAEMCAELKEQENIEFCPDASIFLQFLPSLPSSTSETLTDSPDPNSYELLRNRLFREQNAWGILNSAIVSFLLLRIGKVNDATYLLYNSPTLKGCVFPEIGIVNAVLWHNYACCLLEMQQYDYALQCAEASLSVYEEMKNNGGKIGSYYLLAVTHHLKGESTVGAYFADKYVGAAGVIPRSARDTLASIFEAAEENEKAENLRQIELSVSRL